MSSRLSAIVMIAQMFAFNFTGSYLISLFWNGLNGRDMFPLAVVFWVAVTLSVIFMSIGSFNVTGAFLNLAGGREAIFAGEQSRGRYQGQLAGNRVREILEAE